MYYSGLRKTWAGDAKYLKYRLTPYNYCLTNPRFPVYTTAFCFIGSKPVANSLHQIHTLTCSKRLQF